MPKESYYQTHKEEQRKKQNERRKQNIEEYKKREKQYRDKNREKLNERSKKWYQKNKERALQNSKQWSQNNIQKVKTIQKEWREAKKEQKKKPFYQLAEKYEHKPIPSYEGYYEAFENGKVWSHKFNTFLKDQEDLQQYNNIQLHKDRDYTTIKVSRAIALAFDDRTEDQLKDYECHHCSFMHKNNSIQNLVFLPRALHQAMHQLLDKETIKSIGEQVKQLRGSSKTKQFIKLIKKELQNVINNLG